MTSGVGAICLKMCGAVLRIRGYLQLLSISQSCQTLWLMIASCAKI